MPRKAYSAHVDGLLATIPGTYTVNLIGVGRSKANWTARLHQQPTLSIIERLVRKQKVLASRDIQCLSNDAGDGGSICAGFHVVGRYEIKA